MCAWNAKSHIRESIESALGQDYENLELVVVDDGSTDETPDILSNYNDPRLKVLTLPNNSGIPAALNRGLALCLGDYIARLDADDIALPSRLTHQVSLLQAEPAIGLLGGSALAIIDGKWQSHPGLQVVAGKDIGCRLLRGNQLKSSTVMIRRSVLDAHGLRFNEDFPNAQDYELWCRLAKVTKVANDPLTVAGYRYHTEQQTTRYFSRQLGLALKVQRHALNEATQSRSCGPGTLLRGWLSYARHQLLLGRVKLSSSRMKTVRRLAWKNVGQE